MATRLAGKRVKEKHGPDDRPRLANDQLHRTTDNISRLQANKDISQTWELRPPKGLGVSGPIFQVVSLARFGSKLFNMELYTCPCASYDISDRWFPLVSGGVISNDHAKRSLQMR